MSDDVVSRILLTPLQRIWLVAACEKIEKGQQLDTRALKIELLDKLPNNFRPDSIDPRLLRSNAPTMLGLAFCFPYAIPVQKANIVWGSIHNLLLSKPSTKNATADEITPETGLSKIEVAEILKQFSEIGLYGAGTGYGEMGRSGWGTFQVNERAFDAFVRYKTLAQFLANVVEIAPPMVLESPARQTPEESTDRSQETDYAVDVVVQSSGPGRGYLVISGEKISSQKDVIVFSIPPDKIIVTIIGQANLDKLASYRFSDFSKPLSSIEFYELEPEYPGFDLFASLFPLEDHTARIDFRFYTELWKHPWSITEFKNAFRVVVNNRANVSLAEEEYNFGFEVNCDEAYPIGQLIAESLLVAGSLVSEAEAILEANLGGETLVAHFDFPAEVAVVCEQYLIYFVQFLKDLGVNSTADLRHEAGRLLFSVKPDSQDVALGKIREALNIYLRLPANPSIGMMMPVGDVPTQQLAANVQFLQGNLRLAYATIQQQETTIHQRQETIVSQAAVISTQKQILSGEVVLSALKLETVSSVRDDKEKLLGGIIILGKAEKFGVSIDLAEVLRKSRSLFWKKPALELSQSGDEEAP